MFLQRMLGESKVGDWHRCVPRGAIRLCTCYRFSAESSVDGPDDRFRNDDGGRLWRNGFEDGFELVD